MYSMRRGSALSARRITGARSSSIRSTPGPTPPGKQPDSTAPYSIKSRVTALQTSRSLNPTPFQATQRFLWIQKTPYIPPSYAPPPPPPKSTGVITDATLSGDGVTTPLSVVKLGFVRTIGINATGGTVITETPAPFDGSANAAIGGFEVVTLDGGSY